MKNTEKNVREQNAPFDVMVLYDKYYDKIFRYTLNRTGDVELSRDITADVFLKAHKNRWKFVFTGAPISAWLFKIAGNEIISFARKRKNKPLALETELKRSNIVPLSLRGDLQDEILAAQEKVNQNAIFRRVHKQLCNLPNKYQEVITLRYLEEKSIAEIAFLLGKKPGTVKSLLSRGIAKLKRTSNKKTDVYSQAGLMAEASPKEGVRIL